MNTDMGITSQLTVVTVTYGNRWHLLKRVLREVLVQGVREVVLVDNAAILPIDEVTAEFGNRVTIIHLSENRGSAVGFKTGLQHALVRGAEYILLLDDDNIPAPGSLATLRQYLGEAELLSPPGLTAVLGNRCHPGFTQDISAKSVRLHSGSFLGFHYADIPSKIMRRLGRKGPVFYAQNSSVTFESDVCTYGGLMFHRSLVEKIGFPRDDFVLYVDDYEWTYRITSQGGRIVLVEDAQIIDLELQWNLGLNYKNRFEVWLHGESDARAFYTARNLVYFELYLQPHIKAEYRLNKFLFLLLLRFYAVKSGKKERLSLCMEAIDAGEGACLGNAPKFKLN